MHDKKMCTSVQIVRAGEGKTITAYRYSYRSEVVVIRGLSGPKMVEFCYDNHTRELEPDHGADLPYYEAHDIIVRKGKMWVITRVAIQHVLSGPQTPLTLVISISEHQPETSSSSHLSAAYRIPSQINFSIFVADDVELW
jgi:hypothetical protein